MTIDQIAKLLDQKLQPIQKGLEANGKAIRKNSEDINGLKVAVKENTEAIKKMSIRLEVVEEGISNLAENMLKDRKRITRLELQVADSD